MKQSTQVILEDLFARYTALEACATDVRAATEALLRCFVQGGKLLVCGNGGSASDSEHIVGELMKAFKLKRPLDNAMCERLRTAYPEQAERMISNLQGAVPAISLVSETALMTAFGNDVSAEMAFAQQVLGYGRPGDILLAITTSGNSENVLYAARMARVQQVTVLSLTGRDGGCIKSLSDICICVPAWETYQIQEYHLPIYHCLCASVENELFGEDA